MSLSGVEIKNRAVELKPKRNQVFRALDENPALTSQQLSEMFEVRLNTAYGWKRKHSKQSRQKPVLSWEQVLKACPEVDVLGLLLVQGFTKQAKEQQEKIRELENKYDSILKDRMSLMRQHNQLLLKTRSGGHLTIDSTQKILVPKT